MRTVLKLTTLLIATTLFTACAAKVETKTASNPKAVKAIKK